MEKDSTGIYDIGSHTSTTTTTSPSPSPSSNNINLNGKELPSMMEFKEKDTTSGNNGRDKKKRVWSIFGGKKTARKVFGVPLGDLECYENTRIPILTVHTIEYLKTFGRPFHAHSFNYSLITITFPSCPRPTLLSWVWPSQSLSLLSLPPSRP